MTSRLRFGLALSLFSFLSALSPAQERLRDVIYLRNGGVSYTMDIFKPKNSNHRGVIFVVSGGWFSSHEMLNADIAKLYTDQGFTLFEVLHGSQPKYTLNEIVPELHRAIRFVRANAATYDIDGNKLGITGASAGGHLSLLLAGTADNGNVAATDPIDRQPDTVQAIAAFYPPTDFLDWGKEGASSFHLPQLGIFMPAFGVTPSTPDAKIADLDKNLAPIHFVGSNFPPTLLVHGDMDPLVPIQQSKLFDAELTKKNIDHKFMIVPGGKHDAGTFLAGMPAALAWFSVHLR
jgi:acetyl esterase/lipase